MARKRNYREEYRRRIERGLARGLSRSQSRGHPKANERLAQAVAVAPDPKIDAALLTMNRGQSLTTAARGSHVSVERLRRFVFQQGLAQRKGRRWIPTDTRPRQIPVMTSGEMRILTVASYNDARLVGEHHNAVAQFVRSNDIELLQPFEGTFVRDINGRRYPLETDPNALHRIAAMDTPPFHEIYEITSSS